MIRRVFSSLPWVLLAQVRGQCPSWSDEGLVELCGKPCIEWCWGKNNDEAACVKSFVLLGSGAYAKCEYDRAYDNACHAAPDPDEHETCPPPLPPPAPPPPPPREMCADGVKGTADGVEFCCSAGCSKCTGSNCQQNGLYCCRGNMEESCGERSSPMCGKDYGSGIGVCHTPEDTGCILTPFPSPPLPPPSASPSPPPSPPPPSASPLPPPPPSQPPARRRPRAGTRRCRPACPRASPWAYFGETGVPTTPASALWDDGIRL